MAATLDPPRVASLDFSAVCEEHLDDIFGYLLYLTHNATLAEDLTADSFERALRKWNSYNPRRGDAYPWLLTIARRVALDHFRSERRRSTREAKVAEAEAVEEHWLEGISAELEQALAHMPASDRELVFLRVVLEMDNREVARVLSLTPTNCATRLSRALDKLQREIK
jgi:RNA polymerase sigma-70 factor (ECF subfamily)